MRINGKHVKTSTEIEQQIIKLYQERYGTKKIAEKYNLCEHTVGNILKRNNIEIRNPSDRCKKYFADETYFERIDTELKAYFLGWMYSDGHINDRSGVPDRFELLICGDEELEILERFKLELKFTGNIRKKKKLKERFKQPYRLNVGSRKIANDLVRLGCPPRKSLIIKFPTFDQVPEYLMRHFIRGFMEGDGCVSFKKDKDLSVGFLSTEEFCCGLKKYLEEKINIFVGVYKYRKTAEIKISNLNGIKFYNFIYEDCTCFLPRKKLGFDKYIEFYKNKVNCNDIGSILSEKNAEDVYKSLKLPNKGAVLLKYGEKKVEWIRLFINEGMTQRTIMDVFKIRFSSFYKIVDYLQINFKPNTDLHWRARLPEYKEKEKRLIEEYQKDISSSQYYQPLQIAT